MCTSSRMPNAIVRYQCLRQTSIALRHWTIETRGKSIDVNVFSVGVDADLTGIAKIILYLTKMNKIIVKSANINLCHNVFFFLCCRVKDSFLILRHQLLLSSLDPPTPPAGRRWNLSILFKHTWFAHRSYLHSVVFRWASIVADIWHHPLHAKIHLDSHFLQGRWHDHQVRNNSTAKFFLLWDA